MITLKGTIGRKLTAITLITSATALILACTIFFAIELVTFRMSLRGVLEQQARNIAENTSAALVFRNPVNAREIVSGLSATHGIIRAEIFGSDRQLFASYSRPDAEENRPSQNHLAPTAVKTITLSVPIALKGERVGTVVVTASLRQIYRKVFIDTATLAGVLSLSLLVSFVLIRRLQKGITTPLNNVLGVMNAVSRDGDYGLRAAVATDDEIGHLARQFNMMLAEIEIREQELRLHRHNLEEQVRVRTDQLERAKRDLEEQLAQKQNAERMLQLYADDLQEANEEVRSFAYIVSHDLRAPLVNIKGFSAELQEGVAALAPVIEAGLPLVDPAVRAEASASVAEDIPECLAYIDSSITRMESLISSILNLSRIGRRVLKPEPVDLNDLVARIIATLKHQVESRNVTVTIEPLPSIEADRTALEQIFGNLLDNAVKYLAVDRPGRICVACDTTDSEPVFSVSDNGRGIRQDHLSRIFDIFHRAGVRDVAGEGIGLAYVKTLVRRHGGRIWCESEEGTGTTFRFTLPTARAGAGRPTFPR